MDKPIVLSYGGGTQTIALWLLIEDGRLAKPDRVVMADTGYEFVRTWEYTEKYIKPRMEAMGLTLEVIPHSEARVDLFTNTNEVLIPAFSTRSTGKLQNFCSGKWKTEVVRRYVRRTGIDNCQMWIGMSLDEIHRMKSSGLKWCENYYPLCFDVKFTRGNCVDYVRSHGLPEPPKSRCKICPNQSDDLWLEVQQESAEWQQAIELDEKVFATHGVRLHKSCQPLSQVVFIPRKKNTSATLFDDEDRCNGECWI